MLDGELDGGDAAEVLRIQGRLAAGHLHRLRAGGGADRVQRRPEHVQHHQPLLTRDLDHRLAQTGVDEGVEHGRAAARRRLQRPGELLAGLDPGVAVELGLEVLELALRRTGDPGRRVACRVGDDVDLEGVLHREHSTAGRPRCGNAYWDPSTRTWVASRIRVV